MTTSSQTEITPEESLTRYTPRGVRVRLFLTCWMIFALHFSPFVVRELYLTLSLAERATPRVDEYLGLHSDLFVMEGRGAFMGGNPGVSILAAVPYWLALPVVQRLAPVRPPMPGEKVSAAYAETRANKLAFYREVRRRGLDIRLGLAALITAVLCMAPLAAWSAVVTFNMLGRFGFSEKFSLWMALLYAVGTPIFFRAATLSLNLLVALLGLFSFALLWSEGSGLKSRGLEVKRSGGREENSSSERWRYVAAGFLAGYAVFTDFTGAITAAALGLFALACQMERKPFWPAVMASLWFLAGALVPIAGLLCWQWVSYGNPWLPAQFHMPKQIYVGYPSEHGFGRPQPAALWGLIFDPLYGLLVFCPLLAVALYHPVLLRRRDARVPARVAVFAWSFFAALWLFCSSIHYTTRHQWQDGVRYIVPAVPFLFFLVADVLARAPRWLAYPLALVTVVETWALSMVRESPYESLARVFSHGPELPAITALSRTAAQYFPPLAEGASMLPRILPAGLIMVCGAMIWGMWFVRDSRKPRRGQL